MSRFRFRYRTLGGHVHVRVFAGPEDGTLAKCGDLTFRVAEWADFRARLGARIVGESLPVFDIIEEAE